jgi:hypothetical protein
VATLSSAFAGGKRNAAALAWWPARRASRLRRRRLHVTLGELVEAVASVTADPIEQVVVVDHILRTRGAGRGRRHAGVVA